MPLTSDALLTVNGKSTRQLLEDDQFIAMEQKVTIRPNFETRRPIQCIAGSFGRFRYLSPIEVPLWLALELEKKKRCTIEVPKWMEVDSLKRSLEAEREEPYVFLPLDHHYIETGLALLSLSTAFTAQPFERLKMFTTLKELIEVRRAKIIQGMLTFDSQINHINVTNMAAVEIASVRGRTTVALDTFRDMLKARALQLQVAEEGAESTQGGTDADDASAFGVGGVPPTPARSLAGSNQEEGG